MNGFASRLSGGLSSVVSSGLLSVCRDFDPRGPTRSKTPALETIASFFIAVLRRFPACIAGSYIKPSIERLLWPHSRQTQHLPLAIEIDLSSRRSLPVERRGIQMTVALSAYSHLGVCALALSAGVLRHLTAAGGPRFLLSAPERLTVICGVFSLKPQTLSTHTWKRSRLHTARLITGPLPVVVGCTISLRGSRRRSVRTTQ